MSTPVQKLDLALKVVEAGKQLNLAIGAANAAGLSVKIGQLETNSFASRYPCPILTLEVAERLGTL